jgi:fatty-acyl-CoA synthase
VTLVRGGAVVTVPGTTLDPDAIWSAAAAAGADSLSIVGDVFARPLLEALDAGRVAPAALARLKSISSSGVAWTAPVKEGLLGHLPWLTLIDGLGATEAPACAAVVSGAGSATTAGFVASDECRVFSADGRPIAPGADEPGYLALGGPLPLGYWGDEEKSRTTFREIDGRRYAFTGDLVRVAADGTITFLGRGSNCINTGGEKVFPEEVEAVLKAQAAVRDALVLGVPDSRYGERVTALVAAAPEAAAETLCGAVAAQLAGYKVPRQIFFIDEVPRLPNGKADYRAARSLLTGLLGPQEEGADA